MVKNGEKYDYDLAISVAGEDTGIAEKLYRKLTLAGLSVFFYKADEFKPYLWGKKRTKEYRDIFSKKARYVLPIISRYYPQKDGCLFEFEVAKKEAAKRNYEYILPLRLDDTEVYGLTEEIYEHLNEARLEEITKILATKIRGTARKTGEFEDTSLGDKKPIVVRILKPEEFRILGILATSIIPFKLSELKILVPEIDWQKNLRKFRRNGLLVKGGRGIQVKTRYKKVVKGNQEEEARFHRIWLDFFKPNAYYPDVGLLYAMHLFALGDKEAAVALMVQISTYLEPGFWNEVYLTLLTALKRAKASRTLDLDLRMDYYHALGLCLLRGSKYRESIKVFSYLRYLSKKSGVTWGTGHSYIAMGVAYDKIGDQKKAEYYCYRAEESARNNNDSELLSHALNNLAFLLISKQPEKAKKLLEESISIKRRCKDYWGIAVAHMGFGNLAAEQGDFKEALRFYKKAEKAADKYGIVYLRSLVLSNMGNVLAELGEDALALEKYKTAKKIAKVEEFVDAELNALKGEAGLAFKSGLYKRSEKLLFEIDAISKELEDFDGRLASLNNAARAQLLMGMAGKARKTLGTALRVARSLDNEEWISVCRYNSAMTFDATDNYKKAATKMNTYGREEIRKGNFLAAGQLFYSTAEFLFEKGGANEDIEGAYIESIRCLRKFRKDKERLLEALYGLYLLKAGRGDWPDCLKVIREIASIAEALKNEEEVTLSLNETGIVLFNLGKLSEAEKVCLKALRLARRSNNAPQEDIAMDTIIEIYRSMGKLRNGRKFLSSVIEDDEKARSQNYEGKVDFYNRALVFKKLVEIALEYDDETTANKIYVKVDRIIREHGLPDIETDLLMLVGDYYWYKNKRSQYTGLEFYTGALIKSVSRDDDLNTFFEIGLHIYSRLIGIEPLERVKRIPKLETHIKSWLLKKTGPKVPSTSAMKPAFWPFKLALSVAKLNVDGRVPSEEELKAAYKECFL